MAIETSLPAGADRDDEAVDAAGPVGAPGAGPPPFVWWGTVLVGAVLRWWSLGSQALTADEQYTGVYASAPVLEVWGDVARDDIHPPLDYVLRAPVAGLHDAFWLRAPSALLSTITLVVVWRWMRGRGPFGYAVVALTASFPFFVLYGRTARMYALLILVSVLVVRLAERWLHGPRPADPFALAALLVLGLFTDSTAVLLAAGAFLLPGWRTDGAAWRWRAGAAGGSLVWLALWGPTLREHVASGQGEWIPLVTPTVATQEVGRLVATFHNATFGVAACLLIALGGLALARLDRSLARTWVVFTVVPIVAAVLAGTRLHVLIARSLSVTAIGIVLGLAAVAELVRRRWGTVGVVGAVALALLVVGTSVPPVYEYEEDTAGALRALDEVRRPGDVLVLSPGYLGHLFSWSYGAPRASQPTAGVGDPSVFVLPTEGPPTDRVWVLESVVTPWRPAGLELCPGATAPAVPDWSVRCYEVARS